MGFYTLLIVITILIAFIVKKLIYSMLIYSNAIRKNYLDQDIPVGMGMIFPIALICSMTMLYLFFPLGQIPYSILFGIVSMSFLGIVDDLLGNRDTTGLKGHIGKLFQLQLTTGGLKAVAGGVIAILVSMPFQNNFFLLLLDGLIIALFTNLINLLDLRPGRAMKAYLFYAVLLATLFYSQPYIYILYMVTIIVIIYFPMDVKARAMMGDVGSNSLGFVLGFFTIIYFDLFYKIGIAFLLIIIHIYAERSSLSKLIEKNTLLRYIDRLGR